MGKGFTQDVLKGKFNNSHYRTKIKFVIQLSVLQRVLIFLDLLLSASQTSEARVKVSGLTCKQIGS